jgi:hypothetical protein
VPPPSFSHLLAEQRRIRGEPPGITKENASSWKKETQQVHPGYTPRKRGQERKLEWKLQSNHSNSYAPGKGAGKKIGKVCPRARIRGGERGIGRNVEARRGGGVPREMEGRSEGRHGRALAVACRSRLSYPDAGSDLAHPAFLLSREESG